VDVWINRPNVEIDNQIIIVPFQKNADGKGSITIRRIKKQVIKDNYIIYIIVREYGKKKVLKTLTDVYGYDYSAVVPIQSEGLDETYNSNNN
jgi:hypothetical protein